MAVAILTREDVNILASRSTIEAPLVVVALCAAWCTTCGEFRHASERLAAANHDALFRWLDIEDDAAVCGDIEVENFPTLAIFREDILLHYGAMLPAEGNVVRLFAEMRARAPADAAAPKEVRALPQSVRGWRGQEDTLARPAVIRLGGSRPVHRPGDAQVVER